MLKKPFSFWQNVAFTDKTRVRISSDGIDSFSKKWIEISWKNKKIWVRANHHLCFGVQYDQMDGTDLSSVQKS